MFYILLENRQVDPYGIVHWNRKWYLVGYCHLRGENRTFRLDQEDQKQKLKFRLLVEK